MRRLGAGGVYVLSLAADDGDVVCRAGDQGRASLADCSGRFPLQPSEFAKPAFVVLAAAALAESNRTPGFPGALIAGFVYAAFAGVLVLQPDFGQTMLPTIVVHRDVLSCRVAVAVAGGCSVRRVWAEAWAPIFFVPHVASRIDRFWSADGRHVSGQHVAQCVHAWRLRRGGPR